MYFVFSKILLFLILPFNWALALLVIALMSKSPKRRRGFLISAIVVLYVFSNSLIFYSFEKRWDIRASPIDNNKKYSCVIVLGGFSGRGGPSGGHFSEASDRFIQGIKLIATKKASHILISGGSGELVGEDFREAPWVRGQLLEQNIPDSLILTEGNSKNTIENARFSKIVLDKARLPPPYLLVTSSFHMRRSLMIFKKAGIDVVAYPADFTDVDSNLLTRIFMPRAQNLAKWEFYTKEVVGYAINYFQ